MTDKQRIIYVDCVMRVNGINLDRAIIKNIIKCVDIVDKSKGKARLDEVLI